MAKWEAGKSANPGGRGKKSGMLARLARSRTEDGLELVEFALKVLRGEETTRVVDREGGVHDLPPAIRERLDALKWLADRGWGKAIETVEIVDETTVEPSAVPTERLEDGLGPQGTVQ